MADNIADDKLPRIGLQDSKSRADAAVYFQACLAHGSGQAELSELISLKAKTDGQSVIDVSFTKTHLLQSYKTLFNHIPQICADMLQCEERDFDLISKHLSNTGEVSVLKGNYIDRMNQSVLFPIAKFSHRRVEDFLLGTRAGKDLLAASPLSTEDVFLGFVEANLMRSLLGVKFFRLAGAIARISSSWNPAIASLPEHTLHQALSLIETSIPRIALVQNRLQEETKQKLLADTEQSWLNVQFDLLASDVSSHWPKSIAIDIDGLALENRIFPFTYRPLLDLSKQDSDNRFRLSQRYKDYLLLCCLHCHSSDFGVNANTTFVSTLIDQGADPYAIFFLPPSEPKYVCVVAELVYHFYLDYRLDCNFDFWIGLLKRIEIKRQRCIIRAFTGSLQYVTSSTSMRETSSFMDIWLELDVADYLPEILETLHSQSSGNLRRPLLLQKDGVDTKVMLSEARWPFDEEEPVYVSVLDEKDSTAVLKMMDTGIEQDRVDTEMYAQGSVNLDKMETRWEQFHTRIEEFYKSSSASKVELTAFLREKGYIPDPSDLRVLNGPIPRFETVESARNE